MEIKKICIKDFKGIEALRYEPEHKTAVLIAPNGTGKTSFKEAVYAGLTGVTPPYPIRNTADSAYIGMQIAGGTTFSRTFHVDKPTVVEVNGKKVTGKALAQLLSDKTGIPFDTFKIVSSADALEKLSSADFGTLLINSLKEKLTLDDLKAHIPLLTAEMEAELNKVFPPVPTQFELSDIDKAYEGFFEQRKLLKKAAAMLAGKVASYHGAPPPRTLEEVNEELLNVITDEAGARNRITALSLYNSAKKNREMMERNIADIETKIAANTATRPRTEVRNEIANNIKAMNAKKNEAKTLIGTLTANISLFEGTLANLNKPVCPISEKLICTTDKTGIKAEVNELLEANREGVTYQQTLIETYDKELNELEKSLRDFDDNKKRYNEKILLMEQKESLVKALPVVPEKPNGSETSVDYGPWKKSLNEERDRIVEYKKHQDDMHQLDSLNAQVTLFDNLVADFAPKGIVRSNVINHYLSVIETACNDRAAKLRPGFEMRFKAVDGITYTVKTDASSCFKPFVSLSSGEKVLATFLIVDLLNQFNAQKILMLDDLDKLDATAFEELLNIIQSSEIQDSYDHIFLMAVNHDDIKKVIKGHPDIDII